MNKLIKVLLLIIVFYSCTKEIPINIKEKQKHIDVIGIMNPDDTIKINISKSISVLESSDKFNFINNATVKLYINNIFEDTLSFKEKGNYVANLKPIAGNTYKMEVITPDDKKVNMKCTIPNKVNIESVDTLATINDNEFGEMLRCKIKFSDPSEIKNYYIFNIKQVNTYDDEDSTYVFTTDVFFQTKDPITNNNIDNGIMFNDDVINGQTYSMTIDMEKTYTDSAKYYFNLISISKDYYLYLETLIKQIDSDEDPFSEAVQIYTNINNGVGILGAMNKSTFTLFMNKTNNKKHN